MGKKRALIYVIVVVVLLIIIAAIYKHGLNKVVYNSNKSNSKTAKITVNEAPQGQIASGFPKALILDSSAEIISSYNVPQSGSASIDQYSVDFRNAKNSVTDEYNEYLKYFTNNKYDILQKFLSKDNKNPYASLYTQSSEGRVNLLITKASNGQTNVLITYLINK